MSVVRTINGLLSRIDLCLVNRSILYDWQTGTASDGQSEVQLPPGAAEYLRTDNPRLQELRERYARFQENVSIPVVWTDEYVHSYELRSFRGDNCYVWQTGDPNCAEINYCLTACYLQQVDRFGVLERTVEDGLFGVYTCRYDSRLFSRDLMDSTLELNFLEQHLQLSRWKGLKILDVGAGYGRLAYRAVQALPELAAYLCTDAVPESTFLSEYHLSFRGVSERAVVVPLDEIEQRLLDERVDLAVNIHSFSECSLPAIEWWLALLKKNRTRYLFLIPNHSDHGGTRLALNSGEDFSYLVEQYGYTLKVKEPKYSDPLVQKYGVSPTWYYLYELT